MGGEKTKAGVLYSQYFLRPESLPPSMLLKLEINNKYCPKKSSLLNQLSVQCERWVHKNTQHSLLLQNHQKWKHLCCYKFKRKYVQTQNETSCKSHRLSRYTTLFKKISLSRVWAFLSLKVTNPLEKLDSVQLFKCEKRKLKLYSNTSYKTEVSVSFFHLPISGPASLVIYKIKEVIVHKYNVLSLFM